MAKQNARKQFVQARLKALGGDATPEQKAKLRQRFNKLSETKEGRTRIAQVVLPNATAEQRKALKQSLRPTKTSTTGTGTGSTGTGSTGSTTNSSTRIDLTGVRDARPYRSTVISDGNTAKNNFQSSAVIPSNKINIGPATELPLGVGGVARGVKMIQGGNYVGGVGRTLLGVAEVGVSIASVLKRGLGKSTKIDANLGLTSLKTNPFVNQKVTKFDLSNLQKALESYKGTPTTPSKITGANKPTSMPTVPNFAPKSTVPEPKVTPAPVKSSKTKKSSATTVPTATTVPLTPAQIQARLDAVAKTPAEKAAAADLKARNINIATKAKNDAAAEAARAGVGKPTTATTVPKSTATTVPKSTTPTTVVAGRSGSNYDGLGTRTSGSYKDPVLGDLKPTQPSMPRGLSKGDKELWKQSDAMLDYENALYAWQKFNKKP